MKYVLVVIVAILLYCPPRQASADEFGSQLASLAGSIAEQVKKSNIKNIAVADFVDLRNETNELGRLLAEEITTALIGSGGDYSVIR